MKTRPVLSIPVLFENIDDCLMVGVNRLIGAGDSMW